MELLLDRRAPLAAHELLALERAKSLIEPGRVASAVDQRAPPEHLADHGGVLKQLLLDAGQRIEARGDETLKRVRQLKLRAVARLALLDDHPCKLLGVQGISTRAREDSGLHLCRQDRPLQDRVHQLGRFRLRQRGQRQRRGIGLPTAPVRPAPEQLWARRSDDQQRHRRGPVDEAVDEVE